MLAGDTVLTDRAGAPQPGVGGAVCVVRAGGKVAAARLDTDAAGRAWMGWMPC